MMNGDDDSPRDVSHGERTIILDLSTDARLRGSRPCRAVEIRLKYRPF